jgi:opacity protein-like surface antigen
MKTIYFWALLCACLVSTAQAQDDKARFELTPFGGYRFGGTFEVSDSSDSYDFNDSSSFGLILNFPHRADTQWEILYSKQSTEAEFSAATPNDPVIDVELQVLQLGGTYQFEGDMVLPYIAATLGATHARVSSTGSSSDTFWSGSFGLGVLISPNSRVGLRLEARAYGTLTNSGTSLLCASGPNISGCAIRIDGDLLTQIETFAGVVFRF